ncbi:MAG: ROK family protein [FCB group bacterium]|nr:ROK family protein [FCB group bacterium]
MGRHNTRMGILNFGNQIITDIESYEIHLEDPEGTVNEIVDHANAMIESATIDRQKLLGIGIALPGLVNSESGRSYSYFDFEDTTIRTVFEQKFSKPVVVENDARAMTLGEWRYGLAQDRSNVLNLNIGWGVGVGMILNGKLYPGGSGFAGELGHIRIAQNGLLCHCGKRGCLETVASGTALARLAKEGIKTGNLSILNKMVNDDLDAIEAGIVIQAANDGDEYAIEILGEIGSHLGEGIAVLIHLFNPEMIILGGRISKADKYIIDPIKQALNKFTIEQIRENTKIVVSELQEHAGVMGAAALILESLFDNSNIMSIPIY